MTTPDWEALGRELQAARGSLAPKTVAEAIGISSKQLRNYERALPVNGRPRAERIIALATYYGVDAQPWLELVGMSVPPHLAADLDTRKAANRGRFNDAARDAAQQRTRELAKFTDDQLLDELGRRVHLLHQRVEELTPDVGGDEYDLSGIAARTTRQVRDSERVEHIDPVEQDGEAGED